MSKLRYYKDAKLYYEKDLQINSNLTSILSEKELTAFNKLMNLNIKLFFKYTFFILGNIIELITLIKKITIKNQD